MVKTEVRVGPTHYGQRYGFASVGRYSDGQVAIALFDVETGESLMVPTVCMADYTTYRDRRHVWIKTWSENLGAEKILVDANVVELTGVTHPAGFATAVEGRLTDWFIDQLPPNVQNYIKG